MSAAARSILVYAVYLLGQGVVLLAVPNLALRIFGLRETTEVWVRIVGMTVVFFSIYYAVAARYDFRPFFQVSVATRLSVPLIFGALVVTGLASWNILLFTPIDIVFALWTWLALRSPAAVVASAR